MVLFARVVEAGSFAAAAKQLGQTRASVSKQIGVLEEGIGAQLLQRTTRTMHLTEIGQEFYRRCARIAEEAEEALRVVASLQGAPRGRLRIAAPVTFGRRYLAPLVADFLKQHPEIQVDLSLSDAPAEPADDGFDVALRVAPSVDSTHVARCLAASPHVVCASPAYFERHPPPKRPEDLRGHDCLLYSSLPQPSVWRFRGGKIGLGIAYMPTFIAGEDLALGQLSSALDDWAHSVQKVWLVHARSRNLAPKVRVFVEFLSRRFEGEAPWERGHGGAAAQRAQPASR